MEKSYLKYDEFFKSTTKRFFELLGCKVITEFEIFKLPKKVDIVIIKKSEREFVFFDFFKDFNIISFKSERDKATIKDFRDMFIYLHGYCNMEREAELRNTVMIMITPKIPQKLLEEIRSDLELYKRGVWRFKVNTLLYVSCGDK
ncbi:MAG: hypothetical protein KatS3mg129_2295 [Leptospiraceae bacterium]|nr:MAG: hypothetical protein KatS3mg129_2295 [Leptospiraceae bacterium]